MGTCELNFAHSEKGLPRACRGRRGAGRGGFGCFLPRGAVAGWIIPAGGWAGAGVGVSRTLALNLVQAGGGRVFSSSARFSFIPAVGARRAGGAARLASLLALHWRGTASRGRWRADRRGRRHPGAR